MIYKSKVLPYNKNVVGGVMVNLKNVEYFIILAEELNFTRAAERVYISQQALSSMVQRMEEEYNVRLLERKPVLRLTAAGEALVFYGRQLLEKEKMLTMTFADISKSCNATLRIGISRLRSSAFFCDIWKEYFPQHKNISFELVDGRSTKFEKLLHEGKISMYIGVDVSEGIYQKRYDLTREKATCCISLAFLKRFYPDNWKDRFEHFQRNGVSLAELEGAPLILQRGGNRLRESLDECLAHGDRYPVLLECDQQDLIYRMVQLGAGVGIVSPLIAYLHLNEINHSDGDCWIFKIRDELPVNQVSLVYRTDYPMLDYERDFMEVTKQVFKRYQHEF